LRVDLGRDEDGDVVGEDRQFDRRPHGAEVSHDLGLVRLEVEGGGEDDAVGAKAGGDAGVLDDGGGTGIADAGDDRHAAAGGPDADVEHLLPLVGGEEGRLAGRAEEEEPVDPGVEEEGDERSRDGTSTSCDSVIGVATGGMMPARRARGVATVCISFARSAVHAARRHVGADPTLPEATGGQPSFRRTDPPGSRRPADPAEPSGQLDVVTNGQRGWTSASQPI
jgi:hypothetical protein